MAYALVTDGTIDAIQGNLPTAARRLDADHVGAEIRERLATFSIRRSSVPALVETVTLQVTISADAPPGRREEDPGIRRVHGHVDDAHLVEQAEDHGLLIFTLPALAAAAMALSSVTVVGNSLRLNRRSL